MSDRSIFDSPPLASDLEVVGNPVLKVRVSADVPVAKLAVRLTQVTPEGKSWAFTMGLLNLTHRDSHEEPRALEPGRSYDVEVPLTFTSMRLKAGNRLRVALSENFWPLVWPSPKIATLTVTTGVSTLVLPVRTLKATEDAPRVGVLRNKVRDQVLINGRGDLEVRRTGPDAKGWVKVEKNFRAPRHRSARHRNRGDARVDTARARNANRSAQQLQVVGRIHDQLPARRLEHLDSRRI